MTLTKLQREQTDELVRDLGFHANLTYKQRADILSFLEDGDYVVYKIETRNVKSHWSYRLTLPLFVVTYLLILASMPVKWLLTGNGYYKVSGKLIRFMDEWRDRMNYRE